MNYRAYLNRGRITDVVSISSVAGGPSVFGSILPSSAGAMGGVGGEGMISGATIGVAVRLPERNPAGCELASTTGPQ